MPTHRHARVAERIGEEIADHRSAAFLITSATLVLMADAARRVLPDETEADALTWVLLALTASTVVVCILVPARLPADRRMFAAFALGVLPAVYGFAGAIAGSPPLLMWTGTLIAICLIASCLLGTPRGQWEPH